MSGNFIICQYSNRSRMHFNQLKLVIQKYLAKFWSVIPILGSPYEVVLDKGPGKVHAKDKINCSFLKLADLKYFCQNLADIHSFPAMYDNNRQHIKNVGGNFDLIK